MVPIAVPFQVPAVIVLNEALPKRAAPVKEEVPVTERAEIEVVVKAPWPRESILVVLAICNAPPAVIFRVPRAVVVAKRTVTAELDETLK